MWYRLYELSNEIIIKIIIIAVEIMKLLLLVKSEITAPQLTDYISFFLLNHILSYLWCFIISEYFLLYKKGIKAIYF